MRDHIKQSNRAIGKWLSRVAGDTKIDRDLKLAWLAEIDANAIVCELLEGEVTPRVIGWLA